MNANPGESARLSSDLLRATRLCRLYAIRFLPSKDAIAAPRNQGRLSRWDRAI